MNLETVERMIALLDEFPVSEIEVTDNNSRIAVTRGTPVAPPPASLSAAEPADNVGYQPDETAPEGQDDTGILVGAEIVGIFHHATPPARAGILVNEGQALGYIESMKLLHDVMAPADGRVAEVLQEDGRAVEYGSILFRIIPE